MTQHRLPILGLAAATAIAAAAFAAPAQAGGKIARADLIAANCFNCHGFEGESVGVIDGLQEMTSKGLIKRMKEFRSGAKPSTIMSRIAKGYTDAELEAVARYFANLGKTQSSGY